MSNAGKGGDILPSNFVRRGAVSSRMMNRLNRAVSRITGHSGVRVSYQRGEIHLYGAPPFPWSKMAFGFTISGADVTIYGGEIQIGDNVPVASEDGSRTITADHQYIAAEYTHATQTLVIGSPTTTKPVPDETVYRVWLWQFRFQNERASLEKEGWGTGNILAPAMYGD